MDDAELDRLLADYFRMCEMAGIEPLPLDDACEKAHRYADLLEPAFAVSFGDHAQPPQR